MSEKLLPQLSPRLQAIADMAAAKTTGRVIDVGTDHAYLPIWLTGNGVCMQAIASDIHDGPVARARINVDKYRLSDKIETRIADGLDCLDLYQNDTIIIAGMGGLEIIKILERCVGNLPYGINLVLQPQRSIYELRVWLFNNGFLIEDENIVRDRNHFYTIISANICSSAKHNNQQLDELSAWIGPAFAKIEMDDTDKSIWIDYLREKRNTLAKVIRGKPELVEIMRQIDQVLAASKAR